MGVLTIAIPRDQYGLLAVFFPGCKQYRDPVSPFIADRKFIVITEKDVSSIYSDREIIRVTHSRGLRITDRLHVIDLLLSLGIRVTEVQKKSLEALEDFDFWCHMKLSMILKNIGSLQEEGEVSVFELFKEMFDGFSLSYVVYRRLGINYKVLFSSLVTMMSRCTSSDFLGLSSGYQRVLVRNRPKLGVFRKAVLNYIETGMGETDFLSFLMEISEGKV